MAEIVFDQTMSDAKRANFREENLITTVLKKILLI